LIFIFAAGFLLGESMGTLAAAEGGEGFEDVFDSGQHHTFFLFRCGTWIQHLQLRGSLFGEKKSKEDCSLVHRLVDQHVDGALAKAGQCAVQKDESGSSKRYIFLEELLR
jgi:hypothetical protein